MVGGDGPWRAEVTSVSFRTVVYIMCFRVTILIILTSGISLVSLVLTMLRLLPSGRCWIGLGSNPAGVNFTCRDSGVSNHAESLAVGCPGGLSE